MPACEPGHLAPWTWWGNWIISLRGEARGLNKHFVGKIRAWASEETAPEPIVLSQERPAPEVPVASFGFSDGRSSWELG